MTGGGPTWYEPADQWPQHGKPWFREALKKARAAGWWYRKAGGSGHIYGTVYCQPPDSRQAGCKFVVFSTGEAGETVARELERKIRSCTHAPAGDADSLAEAARQMTKVDRLCVAAEGLLDQAMHAHDAATLLERAEDLLQEAGRGADEVDELLEKAIQAENLGRAAGEAADDALGLVPTGDRDPGRLLDLADQTTQSVGETLRQRPPSPAAKELKQWTGRARIKIRSLRWRLTRK
jgi:hypothetical protein